MKRTKEWNGLWFGLLVTMLLTLTACGGGGGGGDAGGGEVTKASVVVGGRAGSATQLSSLVASAVGDPAPIDPALTDAKVTLEVIKADGTSSKYYTVTDAKGAYSLTAEITVGDVVTVTFEKEGFTTFSKTLNTTGTAANEKRQYVVNGKAVETGIIVSTKADGVFKAGGGTAPGFRFGLMRAESGVQRAFASSNEVRRAATYDGSKPEIDINIPGSWAPDATAITAKLAAFDPSKSADRTMFPGEFVGIGGGASGAAASKAAADETAYQLESVSFFSADVTPNDGTPLVTPAKARAAGVSKALVPGNALIYKYIPESGCTAIQKYKDRDSVTTGVQVPLYTYKSSTGKWGYLGEGTLATYNSSTGEYDVAVVADATTSLENLACGSTDYYFAIETAEWTTWWNLDYPILLEEPKTVTLCGTVIDQNSNILPGITVVADGYAKGANSYHSTYSGSDGKFKLEVLTGAGKALANFDFTAYDYSSYPYATSNDTTNGGSFPTLPTTPTTTGCNEIGNVVVPSLNTGIIEGTVLEELTSTTTNPLVGQWVWVESLDNSNYFYNWAQTDANGKFTMKAPLNQDLNVWVVNNSYPVKINGTATGFEATDENSKVTLTPIKQANSAPEVSTWISPNPAKAGKNVTLSAWAWDPEGNEPLTYQWKIDTVNKSTSSEFLWIPTAAGDYSVEVVVTDSKGKAKTVSQTLSVAPAENSLPVIYFTSVTSSTSCGGSPTLTAKAYDPDGDDLTYTWKDAAGDSIGTGAVLVPTTTPIGQVTVNVSDNKGSVNKNLQVLAANQLAIYAATASPQIQTVNNEVQLYAYAYSTETAEVIYTWAITDPDGIAVTPDSSDKFTPTKVGIYTIVLTADDGCSNLSRTITVTVGNAEVILDTTIFSGQQIIVNQPVAIDLGGISLPAGSTFELKDLTEPAAMSNGTTLNPTWTPTTQVTHTLELSVTVPGFPVVKKTLDVIVNPQGQTTVDVGIN